MAKSLAIKPGRIMKEEEMNNMVDNLFSCKIPGQTADGKVILSIITLEEITNRFK